MNELHIEAKTENLNTVLDFINEKIEHCTMKIQNQVGIVIDEVFANISAYAYNPEVGTVTVRVKVDEEITLEFEDNGVEYNPLTCESPDITLDADERDVGGLGILMVKNIMDTVEYKRNGNKNILTIKKQVQ